MSPTPDGTQAAMLRVAEMVGALIEFWGFKRNMGRLWCVLFLHDRPMSAEELRVFLSVSTGTISTTLGELQRWQVVRKADAPQERREFYVAETNIWAMVSRVFRDRELGEIERSITLFREARETFKAQLQTAPANAETLNFADGRVKELLELSKIGQALLSGILAGDSISASPLALFNLPEEE
jgi:DNA-binding transcriptional regulator GbsR (MarR family)